MRPTRELSQTVLSLIVNVRKVGKVCASSARLAAEQITESSNSRVLSGTAPKIVVTVERISSIACGNTPNRSSWVSMARWRRLADGGSCGNDSGQCKSIKALRKRAHRRQFATPFGSKSFGFGFVRAAEETTVKIEA